jgi:hypothetical protein
MFEAIKDQHGSHHINTNISVYKTIKLSYNRVRSIQNRVWALENFNEGIRLAQAKDYTKALSKLWSIL